MKQTIYIPDKIIKNKVGDEFKIIVKNNVIEFHIMIDWIGSIFYINKKELKYLLK